MIGWSVILCMSIVYTAVYTLGEETDVDCYVPGKSKEYRGTMAFTHDGLLCQRWEDTSPHRPSRKAARNTDDGDQNFCRDPDNTGYPWCYTTNRSVRWRKCDVKKCGETQEPHIQEQQIKTSQKSQNVVNSASNGNKQAKHVIHIGVDGLEPSCLQSSEAEHILALGRAGTYTLTKAVTETITTSGPCWAAVLTGLPIAQSGVESNKWTPPQGQPPTGTVYPFPTIFKTIKDQDKSSATAAFYTWSWLSTLMNENWASSLDSDMETKASPGSAADEQSFQKALLYLEKILYSEERSYTFVYFRNADDQGHANKFCTSDEYKNAVKIIDNYVDRIRRVVGDLKAEDKTVIILNSDHGGKVGTKRHSSQSREVPLIIQGAGIKSGIEFTNEVRNIDIAPTVAAVLGLDPAPEWPGRVLSEAFE